jgi:hypothetical protein
MSQMVGCLEHASAGEATGRSVQNPMILGALADTWLKKA